MQQNRWVCLILLGSEEHCFLAGSSRYASGYPHSLDHYAALYGFVLFFIAFFGTWPASNNAAIFAEVGHSLVALTCDQILKSKHNSVYGAHAQIFQPIRHGSTRLMTSVGGA